LAALRIPGCTASFVSPNGLMMTNHHCGRTAVTEVTRPGENLTDDGFYAPSLEAERRAPSMYAEQLIAIEDVTDEVDAALEGAETDAERAEARRAAFEAIQQRVAAANAGDVNVEVISLYNGGRYSAYVFRRYDDVRLVFTPELALGYYGGDPDNFTYPRYTLDVDFFRVYGDDGQPLTSENYFPYSATGVEEGTLVFAIGNPGSTFRLETVAQLEYRRDVREPRVLHLYRSRADALAAAVEASPDAPGMAEIRNLVFSFRNGQKLYEGRVRALNDPMIMARRAGTERQLREALAADAALNERFGGLVEEMAGVQAQKTDLGDDYAAFLGITSPAFASSLLHRAVYAYQYLQEQQGANGSDAAGRLRQQLLAVADHPVGVDVRLLTQRLEDFQRYFGADDAITRAILGGRTPEAAARALIERSALADSASTARAVAEGTFSMDDPALAAAAAFMPRLQAYQSASAGLTAREQELGGRLGRARFDVYGTDVPPDATFSLRLADGLVKGFAYNGTVAPPYTTYYGLYDHYYSYGPGTAWDLPDRWLPPPADLDLSTPLNFVSTADITGGNSGSPVINRDLEIVGLIFDGNIESLAGDYIYLPEANRAVSVDARGILAALDHVYDMDRLVVELLEGTAHATEAEADAGR
ncbi:MAG: S46 family peptidase, partial [Rhodothermales bacterium]|nr:S46 family peptidase [Rhodothermales bacterium]